MRRFSSRGTISLVHSHNTPSRIRDTAAAPCRDFLAFRVRVGLTDENTGPSFAPRFLAPSPHNCSLRPHPLLAHRGPQTETPNDPLHFLISGKAYQRSCSPHKLELCIAEGRLYASIYSKRLVRGLVAGQRTPLSSSKVAPRSLEPTKMSPLRVQRTRITHRLLDERRRRSVYSPPLILLLDQVSKVRYLSRPKVGHQPSAWPAWPLYCHRKGLARTGGRSSRLERKCMRPSRSPNRRLHAI